MIKFCVADISLILLISFVTLRFILTSRLGTTVFQWKCWIQHLQPALIQLVSV